ncbi:MAG: PID-CTERM protein-sorting domain-containing protein [Janthinobacterium lividum]
MKKNTLIAALCGTVACFLFVVAPALAQDGPGSLGPTPNAPTSVPIDGGASILLASGVALGLKKLRDRRRAR